jgi:hypothetical protein
MKWLYSFLKTLYPEMGRFATQREAILAARVAAQQKSFGSFRYFIKCQLAVLVCMPALALLLFLVSWDLRLRVVFAAACFLLAVVWETVAGRKHMRGSLRVQLIKQGVPICLKCGYDLRGLDTARCPECGSLFELRPDTDSQ